MFGSKHGSVGRALAFQGHVFDQNDGHNMVVLARKQIKTVRFYWWYEAWQLTHPPHLSYLPLITGYAANSTKTIDYIKKKVTKTLVIITVTIALTY